MKKEVKNTLMILRLTYSIVPVVAGADKFLNLLTYWPDYVAPSMAQLLPFSAATFMMIVGVIEIAAGIIVYVKPQIGAYIVSSWLTLIALSLIGTGLHIDVAVRDLVMAIGAYVLAQLSTAQLANEAAKNAS